MSGRWLPFRTCVSCYQPVTRCLSPRCFYHGLVHLRTGLHRCGRSHAVHARVRGAA